MDERVGHVEQLRVYPVKSLGGQRVPAALVGPAGLAGDRAWAVATADGERLTARSAPALRGASAGLEGDEVVVRVGDGDARTGAGAAAALAALLGRAVHLVPAADGATHADVAPVHLVSRAALAAGEPHDAHDASCPCSHEDPRANVVLDLDLPDLDLPDPSRPGGADETALVGARLAPGGAQLRITRRPKHCLGVYAEVVVPGRVAQGDPVRLLELPGAGEHRAGTLGGGD